MATIHTLPFRTSRLPRRLLNDGWWLETPDARVCDVAKFRPSQSRPSQCALHSSEMETSCRFQPRPISIRLLRNRSSRD
jgi:hypothetical protein